MAFTDEDLKQLKESIQRNAAKEMVSIASSPSAWKALIDRLEAAESCIRGHAERCPWNFAENGACKCGYEDWSEKAGNGLKRSPTGEIAE